MSIGIGRRQFISAFGGAAIAWPLTAQAQQPALPVIGFLHAGSAEQNLQRLTAYGKGLNEAGFVEGQNVAIDFRWADGHGDRLPDMAADLIRRQVAVIATPGSTEAALVAKAATTSVPIVFLTATDPVEIGLVASLNRPGGNVTGVTSLNSEIAAKRLGLIRELAPQAMRYFALVNPTSALAGPFTKDLAGGAASLGIHVEILEASTAVELDTAFEKLPQQPGTVLLVSTDAFFFIRRTQIIALAARHALPVIFDNREYAVAGGLASYGTDISDLYHQVGVYTGLILKGAKPADLPVRQSTKFEFVINLKAAHALGIEMPPAVLSIADELIE
jgi:putative ABC transport system substrate-binding protein